MSFLEELQKKKSLLKKTEPVIKEVNSKPEKMIVEDENDYDRLMKETYFEVYYNQIEEFTFKSVILPLSLEEIQAIHDAHAAFETSVRLNLGYFFFKFDLRPVHVKKIACF